MISFVLFVSLSFGQVFNQPDNPTLYTKTGNYVFLSLLLLGLLSYAVMFFSNFTLVSRTKSRIWKFVIFIFLGMLYTAIPLISLLAITFITSDSIAEPDVNNVSQLNELSKDRLWEVVQNWRSENSYALYTEDERVCDIATIRLNNIKDDFSHSKFLEKASYLRYKDFGENLARDFSTEEEVLNGWINSPGHLANLQKSYKYSCIQTDGRNVVQMFANF